MRYVIHPGVGRADPNGPEIFLTYPKLRGLYGLTKADIVISRLDRGYKERPKEKHLFPAEDGIYFFKGKRPLSTVNCP